MGARQSRRSVDITTTPKKGEEVAVAGEGEGKLEKIVEPDLKITTNGTLHNTAEIEFADKEEIAKDQIPEEKDQCDPEVKENGLPEATEVTEQNGAQDKESEQVVPQAQETTNGQEKTAESNESKTEEVADAKKVKKEKKKKWSFRSISFSKKDKSKPNKDAEKNGEVKEVVEEAAVENETPSQVQSPVEETSKPVEIPEAAPVEPPAEPVQETPSAETQKPAEEAREPIAEEVPAVKPEEVIPAAAEPAKPVEEEAPKEVTSSPAADEVASKEPEQPAEPAPAKESEETVQPVEQAPPADEPAAVVEETTKEVRTTQEVPPPLPSSNPPSPVTVFAESTKADALPADQVPLEVLSQESGIVEVSSSVQESASASNVEPVVSVGETLVEQANVVESSEDIGGISSEASVITQVKKEDLADAPVETSPPVVESVEHAVIVDEVPLPKDDKVVSEVIPEPPVTEPPKLSENIDEITPSVPEEISCPLPTSTGSKVEPLTPPSTPAAVSEQVSKPTEVVESELPPHPVSSSELLVESENSIIPVGETPVSEPEPSVDSLAESSEQLPELAAVDATPKDVDSLAESTEPLPDPSSVASEAVLRGDSLPDISTESLPSLPEPVSEGLPEPMSLPPVDSVPEPIASDSDPPATPPIAVQPVSSSSVPQDESPRPVEGATPVVLTNGNTSNGLPSTPSDEVIVETPIVSGPLKQVPSNVTKDSEVKEAGDKPSEKVAETAAVEE